MIQEGFEYSYVTNGLALVLLRVPYDNLQPTCHTGFWKFFEKDE